MQVMFFSIAYIYSVAAFLGTYSVLKRLLIHGCDALMSIISNFQNTKTFVAALVRCVLIGGEYISLIKIYHTV